MAGIKARGYASSAVQLLKNKMQEQYFDQDQSSSSNSVINQVKGWWWWGNQGGQAGQVRNFPSGPDVEGYCKHTSKKLKHISSVVFSP